MMVNKIFVLSAILIVMMSFGVFAVCGDSEIDLGETCDDGNAVDGDGCSSSCTVEDDWVCVGLPSVCQFCGNELIEGTEECDDGNSGGDDGCSSSCTVEAGWFCAGMPSVCQFCSNGIIEGTEECDDNNAVEGDGCSSCMVELGYECSGEPSLCVPNPSCGNGIIEGTEQCDDDNTIDGDGCSSTCRLYSCTDNGYCDPTSESDSCTDCSACPAEGMVSWWKGDYGADDSIGNNGGEFAGTGYTIVLGKIGGAFSFDTISNNYVNILNTNSLNSASFSVSFWFKTDENKVYGGLIHKGVPGWRIFMAGADGVIEFDANDGTNTEIGNVVTFATAAGQWHHVVATYDGASKTAKTYLNGNFNNEVDLTPANLDMSNTYTNDLYIGRWFKGSIDEVAFWNYALTDTEISNIYDAGSRGMCQPSPTADQALCEDIAKMADPGDRTLIEGIVNFLKTYTEKSFSEAMAMIGLLQAWFDA